MIAGNLCDVEKWTNTFKIGDTLLTTLLTSDDFFGIIGDLVITSGDLEMTSGDLGGFVSSSVSVSSTVEPAIINVEGGI